MKIPAKLNPLATFVALVVLKLISCVPSSNGQDSVVANCPPYPTLAENDDVTTRFRLPEIAKSTLMIGAWNVRVLGPSKLAQPNFATLATKVIQRYDLILIQEIRDKTGDVIRQLVRILNSQTPDDPYQISISERLGRTRTKEQYAFLYRTNRLTPVGFYQFEDTADVFEREPYIVRFSSPTTELCDFAIIAIHTAPGHALAEIGALVDVYEKVRNRWNTEHILIAGDFNADCDYLNDEEFANVTLRTDERFHWLIDDIQDTTASGTDCSYDRLVTASPELLQAMIPGSAGVFYFDQSLNLTKQEAMSISDHYPVELQLMGKMNDAVQRNFDTSISFTIQNRIRSFVSVLNYQQQLQTNGYDVTSYNVNGLLYQITIRKGMIDDVIAELSNFTVQFPGVIDVSMVSVAHAYLQSDMFRDSPYIPGLRTATSAGYNVIIDCQLITGVACSLSVSKNLS